MEGLDGLSFGRLATVTGLSKSGFFTHWQTKEHLQLDAVDWARRQWTEEIVVPALRAPEGVRRLFALHEERLRFYASGVLPGGCFFFAVQADFDDKPGPVRDRIAQALLDWVQLLERLAAEAVRLGLRDRLVRPVPRRPLPPARRPDPGRLLAPGRAAAVAGALP